MSRMKSLLALQPVIAAGCLFVFLLLRVGLQMDYVIVCFLLGKEGAVPVAKGVSSEHLLSTHNNKLEHRKNHVLFWNPPSPYRHNTPIRVNRSPSIWVELDWMSASRTHGSPYEWSFQRTSFSDLLGMITTVVVTGKRVNNNRQRWCVMLSRNPESPSHQNHLYQWPTQGHYEGMWSISYKKQQQYKWNI